MESLVFQGECSYEDGCPMSKLYSYAKTLFLCDHHFLELHCY